jgi:hypothetical protein
VACHKPSQEHVYLHHSGYSSNCNGAHGAASSFIPQQTYIGRQSKHFETLQQGKSIVRRHSIEAMEQFFQQQQYVYYSQSKNHEQHHVCE